MRPASGQKETAMKPSQPTAGMPENPLLLEPGQAFSQLSQQEPTAARESFDVVVIGAGQAGLSVGYHLAGRGLDFLIIDGAERIGDSWRKRWDSLRLFTPARFDSLDGLPFPAEAHHFPTKDEMADYLESYARKFRLPVRLSTRVERLERRADRYIIVTSRGVIEAKQVVVAMASYQRQDKPAFASELAPDIVQLGSSEYKHPAQLAQGPVLLAGAGNSGSEIAMELHHSRRVFMSGRPTGQVPFRLSTFWGLRVLAPLLLRFVFHHLLTIATPMGRKVRPQLMNHGGPLIRVRECDLVRAKVERVARIVGVRDGLPLLEDGKTLDVKNVVWCTGYRPGFEWIKLSILDERGEPRHVGGLVPEAPGLYFVGLHFLYAMSSTMIHGVGRDAKRIARQVARAAQLQARAAA
jgi:putative flavoprotein involved in K+ transport